MVDHIIRISEKIIPEYDIGPNGSLEGLLISIIDKNSQSTVPNKSNPLGKKKSRNLMGLVRDEEGRMQTRVSPTNDFRSERKIEYPINYCGFGNGWTAERKMVEVPLFLSNQNITDAVLTEDYRLLPEHLKNTLSRGILKTSGETPTDYSILMAVTPNLNIPEGRTGTLLYKGRAVLIEINEKQFTIEIKGVGCPDGDNTRRNEHVRGGYFGQSIKRYGHLNKTEGKREFDNLEHQRRFGSRTFNLGEAVRAAALILYDTDIKVSNQLSDFEDLAYLIRLSPGNIRYSFCGNPAFTVDNDLETVLTSSIGKQYAELASLERPLLHSTIHPENIVRTGEGYVLTDFADCRRLDQLRDPLDFLSIVLNKIREAPGVTERGENNFYSTIATCLGVEWDESTGYDGFIEAIWSRHFAERVYKIRKGTDRVAQEEIEGHKAAIPLRKKSKELHYLDIEGTKKFFEREIEMLKHIEDPVAKTSLNLAQDRVQYLKTQLLDNTDINMRFKQDPESFYGLFRLPYMLK